MAYASISLVSVCFNQIKFRNDSINNDWLVGNVFESGGWVRPVRFVENFSVPLVSENVFVINATGNGSNNGMSRTIGLLLKWTRNLTRSRLSNTWENNCRGLTIPSRLVYVLTKCFLPIFRSPWLREIVELEHFEFIQCWRLANIGEAYIKFDPHHDIIPLADVSRSESNLPDYSHALISTNPSSPIILHFFPHAVSDRSINAGCDGCTHSGKEGKPFEGYLPPWRFMVAAFAGVFSGLWGWLNVRCERHVLAGSICCCILGTSCWGYAVYGFLRWLKDSCQQSSQKISYEKAHMEQPMNALFNVP